MPYIAAFLIAAFGKLFDLLGVYVTKKIALGATVLATTLSLLTAFYLVIRAAILALSYSMTNEYLISGIALLWPANGDVALAAYWTAQVTAYIYREHRENVKALSYIT